MITKLDKKRYFQLLTEKLHEVAARPVKLMEVCGTHTMAIGKAGIRGVLPQQVELISGPGCPVCVTADADIDAFMQLAEDNRVTIATYGDMMRVPGTKGSLAELKARGADIRLVYSALEALSFARAEPSREIVFLGVGFETTAPATAHAVKVAKQEGLANFSIYNLHKTVPEALRVLVQDKATSIDGFILPGHVSVIIGEAPYQFLAEEFGAVGAIAGFEPPEIMVAVLKLVKDINAGKPVITNLYRKVVRSEGNIVAQRLLDEVFKKSSAEWRGLGVIPGSGLALREEFEQFDAARKFAVERRSVKFHSGCRCGEILKGVIKPKQCALFGRRCTPDNPVGPCMVSSEGTCAAYYLYHGGEEVV
ncbi:MAG: hydrogenase formation protein HypD [Firmicutes bacterium]|nr:hydrogenase formation protein HypD [Bacillota bacterium]